MLDPYPVQAPRRAGATDELTEDTFTLVLAGGRGTRLKELGEDCAKPALPFAGHLRIIDFTLSNCINSGLCRVGVLTQYRAQSLIRHLTRTWSFLDADRGQYIEPVPAQQCMGESWYLGTANAVYQNVELLCASGSRRVLVLAGDHVYKMDYRVMLEEHERRGADATVACIDVPAARCRPFGVVRVDDSRRVVGFEEKPERPEALAGPSGLLHASLGIYVFETEFLCRELERDAADPASGHDFGHDVLPRMLGRGRVCAHDFADSCVRHARGRPYWRDVGTLDAYWDANMDVVRSSLDLDLYDQHWPVRCAAYPLPSAHVRIDAACGQGVLAGDDDGGSLFAPGCVVDGAAIAGSILFPRARVGRGSVVDESLVLPGAVVGRNVVLRRAIVAEGCVVPDGLRIGLHPEEDRAHFAVSERHRVTLVAAGMLAH